MTEHSHLDTLLDEAKSSPPAAPSPDLIARVLADAAAMVPAPVQIRPKPPSLWSRLLAPVGGLGGGFALAACAAFGIFAGAGYADTLFSIPGLDGVLAGFSDVTDSTSPLETLSLLMSES